MQKEILQHLRNTSDLEKMAKLITIITQKAGHWEHRVPNLMVLTG